MARDINVSTFHVAAVSRRRTIGWAMMSLP
jgi:hypothetical protein